MTRRELEGENERLRSLLQSSRDALEIFLSEDDRFHVGVGGNPIAIEKMLMTTRETLESLRTAFKECADDDEAKAERVRAE